MDIAIAEIPGTDTAPARHLCVLDCEGGDNAFAAASRVVNVLAALVGSSLVFVTGGRASEAALQTLAAAVAERSRVAGLDGGLHAAQRLFFVVNQSGLRFPDGAFEKILAATDGDAARLGARHVIASAFPADQRSFHAVPFAPSPAFDAAVAALRGKVLEETEPARMGDLVMSGAALAALIERAVSAARDSPNVDLAMLHRRAVVDALRKEQPEAPGALREGFAATSSDGKHVVGTCNECGTVGEGWLDPDIAEFFCKQCWTTFSPDVLRCAACSEFLPWPRGAVSPERRMWECHECRSQMD